MILRSLVLSLIPTITMQAAAADQAADASDPSPARWTLKTADTTLVVGAGADRGLCLYELSGPAGWNWTVSPSPFSLMSHASVRGVQHALNWRYLTGKEEQGDGTKIILTFTNVDPALELTSIWQARPGPGPVRHTMFIRNCSAQTVTISEQESLDIRVVGPGTDTSVWYINDDGSIPDATGVYHDKLAAGYLKSLHFSEAQNFIPFAVVDANGMQGVYVGWEWSLGRMTIAAHNAPSGASLKVGNGDTFKTDLEPGETFAVPPAFIGAYQGDLDDAGNSLRKFLFNYSMPAILKNDPALSEGRVECVRRHWQRAGELGFHRDQVLSAH